MEKGHGIVRCVEVARGTSHAGAKESILIGAESRRGVKGDEVKETGLG